MELPDYVKKMAPAAQKQYVRYWGRHDNAVIARGVDKDGRNWSYAYQEGIRTKLAELLDEWDKKNPHRVVPYNKLRLQAQTYSEGVVNRLMNKHNERLLKRG